MTKNWKAESRTCREAKVIVVSNYHGMNKVANTAYNHEQFGGKGLGACRIGQWNVKTASL